MKKSLLMLSLLLVTLFPVGCCCSSIDEEAGNNEAAHAEMPSNLDHFKYSVSKEGTIEFFGNVIKGIETIENTNNKNVMRLVSEENIKQFGSDKQNEELKLLNDMIDGKNPIIYEDYKDNDDLYNLNTNVNLLFLDYLPDDVSDISGEINNVGADGFDKLKAFYTIEGQNFLYGGIGIVIYAKKGENYYMFHSETGLYTPDEKSIIHSGFKKCVDHLGFDEKAQRCLVTSLKQNVELQELLTDKANELLNSFPKILIDSNEARMSLAK